MPHATRPGDVLGDRYLLNDLLTESGSGRFWRAHDRILQRHVAIHVIAADDQRAPSLMDAARRASTVLDRRILRVLDAEVNDEVCYVVNEWAWGSSFDHVVESTTLGPRRAAWVVAEVADSIAVAHAAGVPHGRLVPENVLVDPRGGIRLIGHGVDAALHGRTGSRAASDVTDLAGLLYCLLTGRWAGLSQSAVPVAPREHGEVLRPRRVRAGVPRPIDLLCDAVLHPHTVPRSVDLGDVHTARGIATYLEEYVGDPAGLREALLRDIPPVPSGGIVNLPPVPEITVEDDVPLDDDTPAEPVIPPVRAEPPPPPRPTPTPRPAPDEAVTELPTQAGLPIFDEDGDVSWLERRTEPVPPPPPFEDPPERPLFAPDPPDGVPRRPRTPPPRPMPVPMPAKPVEDDPVTDSSSTRLRRLEGGFWPFGTGTGHGDTGSGLYAIGTEDGHVPGRSWLRLATGLAAVLLLVIAVVVAVNLQSDGDAAGPGEDDTTTSSSAPRSRAPSAEPITGVEATAFDPQGEGGENDDEAALAVDGSPDTRWSTQSYFDQFGPAGLKTGVGLVLDLGSTREVSSVDLLFESSPTDVELYATDEAPSDVAGLTPVARGTARGTELALAPDGPVSARYLVVWLTSLPGDGAEFRGSIAEVVVRGG